MASCRGTGGGFIAARFLAVKTKGASTWMWRSFDWEGGSGAVSGPFDSLVSGAVVLARLPAGFDEGRSAPPRRAFAGRAFAGVGVG